MRARIIAMAACAMAGLSACGYSSLQRQDENVKATWGKVASQYQRRCDLIPNLVRTVKGIATQEQQILVEVTQACARAGSIQATPELLNDPEAFARYQAAQGQLSQALKGLFAAAEAYLQLRSDANFRDLQARLEDTENGITAARTRYIDAVRDYNITVRSFPTSLTARLYDFEVKPNFSLPPQGTPPSGPRAPPGGSSSRPQPQAANR
jgi:LemA protein